jgi:hypothetical protein
MTKQQKIKEACGNYYESYLKKNNPIAFMEMENLGILDKIDEIEHNNGWIRIESEEDLPKETIECKTCFYDGKNYVQGCSGERNANQLWNAYKAIQITHYKPIETSKPPIY